jgi:NAD(P)-dependent dehydrogenase (short-subunit alcohol dehydrogenase family)
VLGGKSVVITGAGSGVGRASALRFARAGARVVCADLHGDWAEETVRQVEAAGGVAVAQLCDVTREGDVVATIERAVTEFGRLDVMFNNAGVATRGGYMVIDDHTTEEFDRLIGVNFYGVFLGCKHAVAEFKRQGDGGAIVNTGSAAGVVGWGAAVYGAAKGAVHQLTRVIAIECAPFGIRANAICPGAMPYTNYMVPDATQGSVGAGEERAALVAAYHPLGRPITAEDCAEAALFLASDAAHNVTGVLLPVDGGYLAK